LSYISGVTVLGTPAEVYFFGTQYWVILVGIACMGVTVAFVYLPVFLQLQISSSYQYLELRFNSAVRTAACVLFIIDELLFLPIVLYVPSLAFNQVTGVGLHLIGSIVCAVCIFYTSVGGLKAVVWTDTLQILLMFFSVILVIVIGTINIGGVGEVWKRASDGGRLQLWNFDPNPLERHTFWSLVIGGYIYWTAFNSVNQTMVQRYLALPNLRQAQAAMGMFTAGILIFLSFCCFAGVLIYATYYDCDPLSAKMIKAEDQLLPLYVMQTTHYILGIPGLFIAGVFSAALSSLSTVLNSTTAVIMTDILEPVCHCKLTGIWKSVLARGLVIVLGLISIGCLFIVEHLGSVLQVVYTLGAIAAGTSFGVFSLGILFPWANTKGALTGAIAGATLIGWISIGSQAAVASGKLAPEKLPLSVEGCSTVKDEFSVQYFNVSPVMEPLSYSTFSSPTPHPHVSRSEDDVFVLYKLSYQWLTPLGFCTVMVVGLIVSFCTGGCDEEKLNPDLFTPLVRNWLLRRRRQREEAGETKEPVGDGELDREVYSVEFIPMDERHVNANGSSHVISANVDETAGLINKTSHRFFLLALSDLI
ncbi:hypothetical protein J437_LFUL012620, partial [Ladona fulva]